METVPLSESEARFRLVLEASPDGFIILTSVRDAAGEIADFQIEYTNSVAARGVNRTPEELLGQYLLRLFPDCKTSGIFARYVSVAETGVSATFETFYDSKELTGWFRNVVVKLNDGIAVSFSDITDRKQAELALQQQQQHFRIALQTAKLGSWEHDLTTGVLTCSDQCKANFGLPPDAEFTHETLFAALHPDDRPLVEAAIARSIEERTDYEVEERCYHPDGSLHWLIVRGQLVYDSQGTLIRMVGVTLDITERKQFEQSLQAANQRISHILESITDAFIAFDRDWRYTYVNQEAARMLGRSPQELLGQSWQEVFPEVTQQNSVIAQQFEQAMAEQTTVRFEAFSLPLNRWLDVSLFPSTDGLAMYFRDISDRKRTEAALQESQQLFQSFMNYSPVAAFIKDESGRYVYANSWVEQVYGRSQSDLLGKTDFELLPPAIAQQCSTNDLSVLTSGQPMQILENIQHQDGEHIYMSFKFPFRNAAGQKLLAGVAIDVSEKVRAEEELRQREAELRLITNAVPVLISFIDAQQRYRFNNQKYEEWFGKPASQVYGKHMWEVLGDAAYAKIRPYIEQVLAGQEVTFESKIPYKDGGARFISATYVPRIDQQGNVAGFVGLVSDITQRQQAEETIHQNEERLRIAQKAANAGVWNWDIITNQVTWSEEYYGLYGLDRGTTQPSYENWLLSIVEQDRDRVDQVVRNALAHRTDLNVEFRIFHPNRGERWLSAIGQTFYDDRNGQPQHMTGMALDITERKHVELALAKSNQTLEAIIQACPLAIMGLQADGTVKIWNPAAERIFGWSQQEVLGQFLPIIPNDKRNEFLNNIAATMQGQVLAGVETQRLKKGNLSIDVALWSAPVDEAQAGISCLSIVADISDRKQAQAALQQSEAFNRQILASTEDCIKVLDLEGSLLYMNPGGQKLLGANDIASLIGHSWVKFWQKADQRAAQEALNTAKAGGVGTFQGYCPTLNGEPKYWDVQITPIRGADGQVERLLCISRDITERKRSEAALRQSEERYRYLAESIPQLVWTANTEGVLIDINQRWSNFTGLTLAQAQTVGWPAVVHPDDVPILSQKWAIAQQDGSYYQAQGRIRRADGVYRWHLHQAVPLKNEQGQVIKWFGTATDIEDQKQLEQQRIQLLQQEQAAREKAEAANRIKDEFLAVLSHELRSPLNPILGWAKLLQTRPFDQSSAKRALETIERNAKLQTQLIDDLLDISRILRGKMVLNICLVNLVEVIDAALETVRLSAETKGIKIQKVVAGDIGPILGDSGRLQQILWNLLSNAVKFTASGGKIEIRLQQVGTDAQIQVKDTGKGINREFLPHVFEYFRQEDSKTTRKFGGLGLGLAIVRYFTELHGGTVKAESPGEGLGATFTVSLPISKNENQGKTYAPVSANSVVDASPLANVRILVVDDEADMRELIFTILQQTGAQVRVTASAVEALQALHIFKPDVLISDIGMPEMDGYQLMRQVRSLPSQNRGRIPALALTAYAGEINQQQALAAGFHKHIAKPVSPEELVEAIVSLVKW
ncbi:PAS domain S-box protein [Fischerella sp. JS2]|uniref:PAS domain S-box protein n=1 Tax=Fischerella sp. JS2 TaxID=2597771 RepID=UPI0028E85B46|nr:PAS domain S-box protein [Fischerella sp. JS2]